jgi:hypothetical protein
MIVGAGFGRTGTLSLKLTLERLGKGPAFHLMDLALEPDGVVPWQEAAEGRLVDWTKVLAGWKATVDWPGAFFWRQIWEAHPDSKVLLSVRDPETWYRSCMSTIFASATAAARGELQDGPFSLMPSVVTLNRRLVWEGTFHGQFANEAHAVEIFTQHNETVQAIVPPDQLLVYDVNEGWAPLCHFLDVPIPGTPMPHLNDRDAFRALAGLPPLAEDSTASA